MRNEAVVGLIIVGVILGGSVGYLSRGSPVQTTTFTSTSTVVATVTETIEVQSPYAECGFVTSCSATNPTGVTLSVRTNSTFIQPNGSLGVSLDEFNPTHHSINMSVQNNWFLGDLPNLWVCYGGSPPYGVDVFRGYYTLSNVTTATNVLNLRGVVLPGCVYGGNITGFSFNPGSSFTPIGGIGILAGGIQLNAMDNQTTLYSLWSSNPAIYTIAVGDEWGDLVLLHFSVSTILVRS